MAFTARGKDVQVIRNVATGKYTLQWDATQNPVVADDESHAVLSLIYERRGLYWADQTQRRGSDLYTVKEIRKATVSRVTALIEDALQPLVEAGRIIKPDKARFVEASRNSFNANRIDVAVNYTTPNGRSVSLTPSLGY